jgi:rubrerythrin
MTPDVYDKRARRMRAMANEYGLITPDEILRAALEKETQARDFYAKLALGCSVDFVKELLQTLQNEEAKHMHMIQKMLGRLDSGNSLT